MNDEVLENVLCLKVYKYCDPNPLRGYNVTNEDIKHHNWIRVKPRKRAEQYAWECSVCRVRLARQISTINNKALNAVHFNSFETKCIDIAMKKACE